MSYIGLLHWIFIDNFIWVISIMILVPLFMVIFMESQKDDTRTKEEKMNDRIRLNTDHGDEPDFLFNHRAKIIFFLIFLHYFFLNVRPNWLPQIADENIIEMKTSIYLSPVGIGNERAEFLYAKYKCDFIKYQKEAISYKRIANSDRTDALIYLDEIEKHMKAWSFCFKENKQ